VKSKGGSSSMQLASGERFGLRRNWSAIEREQGLTGLKSVSWRWPEAGKS
jgi:hypothetical protein